jgi:uncharacterized protein (DUF433 family)
MRDRVSNPIKHQQVEQTDGAHREVNDRVPPEALVGAFLSGQTPESIALSFPALSVEQVCGALTCYQAHHPGLDAYLVLGESQVDTLRRVAREHDLVSYLHLRDTQRAAA